MADRMTKIVLRGDVRGLQSSMAVANRSMQTLRGEIRQVNSESARAKGQLSGLLKVAAGSAAVVGLGRLVKESVQLEAAYSKTMAQVAVATQAPASALERLDDLAMKLGADTVFSAQDAASAMLQLAKGGLSTAEIEAGALADTLTLASAGELELGRAADVVVQAMGAFRLRANQTDEAVAALAGGANASSASVDDMTQTRPRRPWTARPLQGRRSACCARRSGWTTPTPPARTGCRPCRCRSPRSRTSPRSSPTPVSTRADAAELGQRRRH
jgi:hypothetical protein